MTVTGGVVGDARKGTRRGVAAVTAAVLAISVAGGVQLASAPSAMAQPTPTTTISSGWSHACMIRGSKAYCWGTNSGGQLGNGSVVHSYVPTPVSTAGVLSGKTLTQITAGNGFTCALDSAGAAYCWGSNAHGQIGINSALSSTPVAVSGVLTGKILTQISAGENHVCALDSTGAA